MAAAVDKVNGMSQERKSFTVNDRRHFTSEGEPREDPGEAPAATSSPANNEPAEVREAPSSARESPSASGERPGRAASREGEAGQDFGAFILSLATQAGQLLATEGEEAAGGLEAARHLIAIIEMLKEKTEGRRTESEEQIVEAVLYELRMGYVARTRAGGA